MYMYVNGEFVKKEDARISVFDHGYMYGLGVFETFRIYEGHPFLLDDHLLRLNAGLQELNIEASFSLEQVIQIVNQLLELNQLKDAYVRFNVSAGMGELGLQVHSYQKPTVIVYMKPILSNGLIHKEGVILKIRRNTPEGSQRLKSHHYLNNILAKREIGNDPTKEGIFLTENGFIAEGIVSNIFWVKDGILYTPSLDTGILNGVTRQLIIAMASKMGVQCNEGCYLTQELIGADEVFVTNSIQEIVPIIKINETSFEGNKAFLTLRLQDVYSKLKGHLWGKKDLSQTTLSNMLLRKDVLNGNTHSS